MKIPDLDKYPSIIPNDISLYTGDEWTVAARNEDTFARYWARQVPRDILTVLEDWNGIILQEPFQLILIIIRKW